MEIAEKEKEPRKSSESAESSKSSAALRRCNAAIVVVPWSLDPLFGYAAWYDIV